MKAIHLQTEFLNTPLGLGISRPRFSWNCEGGKAQTAYRITALRQGETVWDSGKVRSSAMTLIQWEGGPLCSRDRIAWSVTLWDEYDQPGEIAASWFELGLLSDTDWKSQWISGDYSPKKNRRYPVDCFRKTFDLEKEIVSARLYATARGVYDVTVNGQRIRDFVLAPGMTDYRKRIQVQTYDVTSLLRRENSIECRLADGWYRGSVAAYGVTQVFGTQISLLAQLEITFADGTTQTIPTDESWAWCSDGPVRFADLKDGEVFDATMRPTYSGRARIVPAPKGVRIAASDNVPVTEHERLSAVLLPGSVLDFGQNIAGMLAFSVRGRKGQKLRFICGEALDADGRVDLSGIQETRPAKGWSQMALVKKLMTGKVSGQAELTPKQEIVFLCSGGEDVYQTSFAVFGFRYVQVEGLEEIRPEDFTAIAVYSDLEQTGRFVCSEPLINRLVENTRWSMKGNFLDVPTDCPTRERLGWTGDAQVFFDTGAYFMNTAPFFRKWLRDMADDQYTNGMISAVIPFSGAEMMYKATGSSVGWADAVYLVPWRHYLCYGDRSILEETWPMIQRYADALLSRLEKDGHYEKGVHLGEWLEPEAFRDRVYGAKAKHPEECTAFLYYSMTVIGQIAKILDKPAEAYAQCAARAKAVYPAYAELDTDRQAKLVRPLALGLLEGERREATQKRLIQAVRNYDYKVGTGFLSTPFILPVLTAAGEAEMAYRMLESREKPGWLSEVIAGATTVWEDWEGKLSQNHYSPGAVCQWLFDTVAGIRTDGDRHFVICPVPGGTLTSAKASYLSPYGTVESGWQRNGGKTRYTFTIPANTTARLILPSGREETLEPGTCTYEE